MIILNPYEASYDNDNLQLSMYCLTSSTYPPLLEECNKLIDNNYRLNRFRRYLQPEHTVKSHKEEDRETGFSLRDYLENRD